LDRRHAAYLEALRHRYQASPEGVDPSAYSEDMAAGQAHTQLLYRQAYRLPLFQASQTLGHVED